MTYPIFVPQQRQLQDILDERDRQDRKWGVQNHGPDTWCMIITEELGEWSRAVLRARYENGDHAEVRKELVQMAAVALSMLECHDRLAESQR